jgi:hypothetical protein
MKEESRILEAEVGLFHLISTVYSYLKALED